MGLLRNDDRIRDALRDQDGLYTIVSRGPGQERVRVIGSIVNFLYGPDDPDSVLEAMAAQSTRIVSLTITDRGYYVNHGSGEFDGGHPDIVHDLARPDHPVGTFGYLAEALSRRRARELPPFTVMSCDNFQNNGDLTRRMLLAFLSLRDPGLHEWVGEHGAFPDSMVDRITPVTTDVHRALVRKKFGIDDAWPVTCEPFTQWVIEDRFAQGRPPWERVGAEITRHVEPYEKIKTRLLNGGHQVMCYISMLLGYRFAPEAMADVQIRRLLRRFMDEEVTPLLSRVPGVDLDDYKRTLLERFADPAINDQLARIGIDGSSRLPEFVLSTVLEQAVVNGPIKFGSFTVASWIRYLSGLDDAGSPLLISDPMSTRIQDIIRRSGSDPREVLATTELFGGALANYPPFIEEVSRAFQSLCANGARATLTSYLDA